MKRVREIQAVLTFTPKKRATREWAYIYINIYHGATIDIIYNATVAEIKGPSWMLIRRRKKQKRVFVTRLSFYLPLLLYLFITFCNEHFEHLSVCTIISRI